MRRIEQAGAVAGALPVRVDHEGSDLTDALRRRCLHAFLDYPPPTSLVAPDIRLVNDVKPELSKITSGFCLMA